ncbi:hypothetical protein QZH41_019277, partial [Actinostola sp. cb2023]
MAATKHKSHLTIGIIGSGIAGLSAAWLLSLQGHEVHLYEKCDSLGLGAHTVQVGPCGDVVDVPIRFFVDEFYTELLSLFRYVGIDTVIASLSPSIQVYGQSCHYKLHNVIFGRRAIPFVYPWELLKNLSSYWAILRDLIYFRKASLHVQKNKDIRSSLSRVTLAEYLLDNNYSKEFTDGFLIPIFAIVSTSSAQDSRNYPVTVVMDFLITMFMTSKTTRRMTAGTRAASKTLAKNIKVKHTNVKVQKVIPIRNAGGELQGLQVHASGLPVETFDHVIIATQANQALKLFQDKQHDVREKALKGFRYVWSEVVIHSDEPNGYHYFERPVVTIETEQALQQLQEIQGCDNI